MPTRLEELEGLNRLEESWLNQGYHKYYMNESMRVPKMAFAERLNKVYTEMYSKIAVSGLVLLPFLFASTRFFVTRDSIPITRQ